MPRKKTAPKTTTIRPPGGGEWSVPRGFGAAYSTEAKHQMELFRTRKPGEIIERLQGALGLIGYTASTETIASWTLWRRVEAYVYAINVHLRASDNPIPRHPKPEWLPEPWGGGDDGSVWGPGPTEIQQ